jgi:anti-sigma factor RsiW
MHRLIQDHLEEVLREVKDGPAAVHLAGCEECREEVAAMRQHAAMLRALRAPESNSEETPRGGFYARVMERIEAQRPIDIWQLFSESVFGRRIAVASMALAFVFSIYLVSSERFAAPPGGQDVPSDQAGVLVSLVTYQEQ